MGHICIALTIAATSAIFAATAIYLKFKSSPLYTKISGGHGNEVTTDNTPDLNNLSEQELEELYDRLEEDSIKNPVEYDDEFSSRSCKLVQEIEHIIILSAEVHGCQSSMRNDMDLQKKIAPLLALRRRLLDELMFMAGVREEYLSLERFNKQVRELGTDGCEIVPKVCQDSCRALITDGIYGSNFRLMGTVISMMNPDNYREIYDDIAYAESSLDAFEGMELCKSVLEMHRRLYSLADLVRVKKLSISKKDTHRKNEQHKKYLS